MFPVQWHRCWCTFPNIAHDLARQLEVQKAGQIRFALVNLATTLKFSRNGPPKPSDFHDGLDKMDRSAAWAPAWATPSRPSMAS